MGTQTSSVQPGKTVLSNTTISPFEIKPLTNLVALLSIFRSGDLFLSIGVGTAIMYISAFDIDLGSLEIIKPLVNIDFFGLKIIKESKA